MAFELRGTGDRLLAGKLASIRASLRRDQRRLDEAQVELSSALALFELVREDQLQGKASLSLATILYERGAPVEALENVSSSLRLLDPAKEPESFFLSMHELVLVLTELGRDRHALAIGELIERLYFVYTGVVFRLRGLWVKGKIHAGLKEWEVAAHYFEQVRDGFLEREMPYDAALAGLDLALAYAERGEHFQVYLLARDMYQVFCAQQIPREASAALILFADAALRSQADVALILSTIQRLDALRREVVGDTSAFR